jgi:hypothetical protein
MLSTDNPRPEVGRVTARADQMYRWAPGWRQDLLGLVFGEELNIRGRGRGREYDTKRSNRGGSLG